MVECTRESLSLSLYGCFRSAFEHFPLNPRLLIAWRYPMLMLLLLLRGRLGKYIWVSDMNLDDFFYLLSRERKKERKKVVYKSNLFHPKALRAITIIKTPLIYTPFANIRPRNPIPNEWGFYEAEHFRKFLARLWVATNNKWWFNKHFIIASHSKYDTAAQKLTQHFQRNQIEMVTENHSKNINYIILKSFRWSRFEFSISTSLSRKAGIKIHFPWKCVGAIIIIAQQLKNLGASHINFTFDSYL